MFRESYQVDTCRTWGTTGQEERVRDKAAELLGRDEG